MPAKDLFHDCVKSALIKQEWIITHDPFTLRIGKKDLFIDLGAEQVLAAERGSEKIAVEIKSFMGPSEIEDLKNALGQYILYQNVLSMVEPNRLLYLAVRQRVFLDLFEEEVGQLLMNKQLLKLIIFVPETEEITQWIR